MVPPAIPSLVLSSPCERDRDRRAACFNISHQPTSSGMSLIVGKIPPMVIELSHFVSIFLVFAFLVIFIDKIKGTLDDAFFSPSQTCGFGLKQKCVIRALQAPSTSVNVRPVRPALPLPGWSCELVSRCGKARAVFVRCFSGISFFPSFLFLFLSSHNPQPFIVRSSQRS